MNLFAKIINNCKGKFKTLSNIWDVAFPQVVTGYRDEFRVLLNIYDGALVFLQTMISLKNVLKVFVSFGISLAKTGTFIDIFTYFSVRKSTVFSVQEYSMIFLWLSFLLITVAWLKGSKGGDLPLIIISNNSINKNLRKVHVISRFGLWFFDSVI